MIKIPDYFLSKDYVIAKEQNLKLICDGNDFKYHSNEAEYDYIKNALTVAKTLIKQEIKQKNITEGAACYRLVKGKYLIIYANINKNNNPYFALYDSNLQEYSQVGNIVDFTCFRKKNAIQDLEIRITQSIGKNNLLLPGLLNKMSEIADEYDNEIEHEF